MLIVAKVTNKILEILKGEDGLKPTIVCHNSDYKVKFQFDSDWDGIEAKTARFMWTSDKQVHTVDTPFKGDEEVEIPEVARTKELAIGVYGGKIRTTTPGVVSCKPSILCEEGLPPDPDPSVYTKLMAMIGASAPSTLVLSRLNPDDTGKGYIVETYADGTKRTTVMEFDEAGNPIKITDADGNETVLVW